MTKEKGLTWEEFLESDWSPDDDVSTPTEQADDQETTGLVDILRSYSSALSRNIDDYKALVEKQKARIETLEKENEALRQAMTALAAQATKSRPQTPKPAWGRSGFAPRDRATERKMAEDDRKNRKEIQKIYDEVNTDKRIKMSENHEMISNALFGRPVTLADLKDYVLVKKR